MEETVRLLKYKYKYYVQGDTETCEEYALIKVPSKLRHDSVKGVLYHTRNKEYDHEIDIDSIEDLTIEF